VSGEDGLAADERARRTKYVQEKLHSLAGEATPSSDGKTQKLDKVSQKVGLFEEPEAVKRARAAARVEQQKRRLPLGPDGAPHRPSDGKGGQSGGGIEADGDVG